MWYEGHIKYLYEVFKQTGIGNSADPDQTVSDQGLYYLLFHLHQLEALLHGITSGFTVQQKK